MRSGFSLIEVLIYLACVTLIISTIPPLIRGITKRVRAVARIKQLVLFHVPALKRIEQSCACASSIGPDIMSKKQGLLFMLPYRNRSAQSKGARCAGRTIRRYYRIQNGQLDQVTCFYDRAGKERTRSLYLAPNVRSVSYQPMDKGTSPYRGIITYQPNNGRALVSMVPRAIDQEVRKHERRTAQHTNARQEAKDPGDFPLSLLRELNA